MGHYQRFFQLWQSRRQNLEELFRLNTLDELAVWSQSHGVLGFNTSAIRLRIVHSLVKALQATHFIETGSYHGATAICAHNCFHVPVWSCEASALNSWIGRTVALGLPQVRIAHGRSESWLPKVVQNLKQRGGARPAFYLDAHAGNDPTSCPLLDELSLILPLDTFLVIIDDFSVPGKAFVGRSYGAVALGPDLIRPALVSVGIRRIFLPSYSPQLERGHARAGFAVFFRSDALERAIHRGGFPLELLRPCLLPGMEA